MPKVQKISISLPQEMSNLINDAIDSGDYASTSEVIRDALRGWKQKRLQEYQQIQEIRQLWQEGVESGLGIRKNLAEIKAEARQRMKSKS